jgi:hypothetical protein
VQSEAGRIGSIAEKEGLRQTKMRTKSGMNDELAPGQLFVTPASPSQKTHRVRLASLVIPSLREAITSEEH